MRRKTSWTKVIERRIFSQADIDEIVITQEEKIKRKDRSKRRRLNTLKARVMPKKRKGRVKKALATKQKGPTVVIKH